MKLIYVLGTCLFLCSTSVSAQVFYVKTSGSDANAGTTWATAFQSIQKALVVANYNSKIFVAKGIYYPDKGFLATEFSRTSSFTLKDGVSLYGGFDPDFGVVDLNSIRTSRSTLSGDLLGNDGLNFLNNADNAFHVVVCTGIGEGTVFDGFHIRGGNANGSPYSDRGAGMFNTGSTLQIKNCVFNDCFSTSGGGGLCNISNAGATLIKCQFYDNQSADGGGMYNSASAPKILDCNFFNNYATYSGGAVFNSSSQSSITNCNFSDNSANRGGSVANQFSTPTITNCTFYRNMASTNGGGIYNATSSPIIVNSSFSANNATLNGGGIYNYYYSTPTVKNCIVWNNTATAYPELGSGDPVTDAPLVSYSIVKGGYTGQSNSANDPLFTSATNFRLQACSPAIDAGSNAAIPLLITTDLDANNRVNHTTVDMGAYEYYGNLFTYYRDFDGDGEGDFFNSIQSFCTSPPAGYVANDLDCNDNHIGSCVECVGQTVWYDGDGDGYGNPNIVSNTCINFSAAWVPNNLDCDDANVNINPGVAEICGNGKDDNCNGQIDENCIAICGYITALSTTDITLSSAKFNWVAQLNPNKWELQYKSTSPGSKWVDVAGVLPAHRSVTVTSLLGNQNYMWHIRAKCGSTTTKYSNSVAFRTSPGITAPTLFVEDIVSEKISVALGVYPNPTSGRFIVSLFIPDVLQATATIRLIDVLGRTVQTVKAVVSNSRLYQTVTLPATAAKGMYQVQILVGTKAYKASLVYTQ